ncbi:hypothetical protein [Salmonella enterica]|uniref:hypothetical protein n=1 Tax=Salmonella enterica TaxID=28901 RepID=UPI001C4431FE|nr:hypothetical protein [Salmonella enterica]EHK6270784.1 hypothetical protein [Salmonella enterica]
MKEYILQAINDRWRVKITDASKKCERVAGLYLNDDLLNSALMSNIGGSLIKLRAVKGHISSVGVACRRVVIFYQANINPGRAESPPSVYCLYRGLGMRDKARKALQQ